MGKILRSRRNSYGLTLVETIVSIFLLAGAILMSGALMQSSFQYQKMSKQRVEAMSLAQKTLDQVRAWAWTRKGGRYNYLGDWSPYRGSVRTELGYQIRVDSKPKSVRLASPCSSLEAQYGDRGRYLDSSVVPVRVTVEWGDSNSVSLFSYVGEPPRIAETVEVRQINGSDPISPKGFGKFSASALDKNGDVIEDMMFRWYLEPKGANPGMGSLIPPWGSQVTPSVAEGPRDGRTARVKNSFRKQDGSWTVVGGNLEVQALARAHGRDTVGTKTVGLSP